jgi:FlaA1/EpsC-like NDP-sugar epimerase
MIFNQKIMIIGGTGSLGNALTDKYLKYNEILIFSRSENNQWLMKQKYNGDNNLNFIVGDIRDKERIKHAIFLFKPSIIIIAAALKHVDVCENNINECINTNIDGIRNIVNIINNYSLINGISFLKSVIFISTDKACAPVNTYGMSKSISERIMIEKTNFLFEPKFINVRYGNVLSSRGSLLPFYNNLIRNKSEYLPITDINMTRFFMTLDESVKLIEYAITNGETGDTIIPDNISSYKIYDIAEYYSNKYSIPIKITGIRPGEKIHETLISYTESLRTIKKDDYYIIKPTYMKIENNILFKNNEYNSFNNVKKLDDFIVSNINKL